jgi:formylglycine-generating enzyme required for sulfatase activity
MSARTGNIRRCPICHSELEEAATRCKLCRYAEIEEADFLDELHRANYIARREAYRAAWEGLETSLREQLQRFGQEWRALENWKEIWKEVQAGAERLDLDERDTFKHATYLVQQFEQEPPQPDARKEAPGREEKRSEEPPPPPPPDEQGGAQELERVRQWVSNLPDGEVDMGAWVELLDSFDGTVDTFFLEAFRDEELKRQFNSFETVSIDASGNLSGTRRGKVKQFVEKLGDGSELVMLKIPGGEFQMGARQYLFEQPVHTVKVKDFYLGKHPVTQAQWKAVASLPKINIEIGKDDSHFKGDDHPVECVSWAEAVEFCARLSQRTGRRYRLPSEAEWEYACRAGSNTPFAFGQTITPAVTNYDGTLPYGNAPHGISRQQTVAVHALGVANSFGLCDMHGNVCEWCADEWHDTYAGAPADGSAWLDGDSPAYRVMRGGSWAHTAEVCRSSDRHRESPEASIKLYYLGLRVALDL